MTNPTTIHGIDCYLQDGTAYLNLEAVARGLGYVTAAASGDEQVRWDTVYKQLADLDVVAPYDGPGYRERCPKFVPENIFYCIAMDAQGDAAEAFFANVLDEVVPVVHGWLQGDRRYHGSLPSFEYEGTPVRAVLLGNGELWLALDDMCRALDIGDPSDAKEELDENEAMVLDLAGDRPGQGGGEEKVDLVNEPGMYRIAFGIGKPDAKDFVRWVGHEVIPALYEAESHRVPGAYPPLTPGQALRALESLVDAGDADPVEIVRILERGGFDLGKVAAAYEALAAKEGDGQQDRPAGGGARESAALLGMGPLPAGMGGKTGVRKRLATYQPISMIGRHPAFREYWIKRFRLDPASLPGIPAERERVWAFAAGAPAQASVQGMLSVQSGDLFFLVDTDDYIKIDRVKKARLLADRRDMTLAELVAACADPDCPDDLADFLIPAERLAEGTVVGMADCQAAVTAAVESPGQRAAFAVSSGNRLVGMNFRNSMDHILNHVSEVIDRIGEWSAGLFVQADTGAVAAQAGNAAYAQMLFQAFGLQLAWGVHDAERGGEFSLDTRDLMRSSLGLGRAIQFQGAAIAWQLMDCDAGTYREIVDAMYGCVDLPDDLVEDILVNRVPDGSDPCPCGSGKTLDECHEPYLIWPDGYAE